jgi:tetratricopeptide (TPR) repeat protein
MRPPKNVGKSEAVPGDAAIAAAVSQAVRLPGLQTRQLRGGVPGQAPPRSARTQYELGLSRLAKGDEAGAAHALREAVALDPALGVAWRKLGDLLARAGDGPGADAAYMSYVASAANDADLMRAATALLDRKYELAERLFRARLRGAPGDVVAMRLLAEALISTDRIPDAVALLERVLDLAPSFAAARYNYASALFGLGKHLQSLPHFELLVAQNPGHVNYRTSLGTTLSLLGRFERAIKIYEGILKDAPDDPQLWLNYGNVLRHGRRRVDSVRAYRTCLQLAPTRGDAWWNIANLKTEPFSADDIAAMRGQLAGAGLSVRDRLNFHYALGFALEQMGDYAESFAHYGEGARLRRGQVSYSADENSTRVRRGAALFTPAFLAARADWGCDDPAPIFIVGLPRAGSTLIEQILASHSAVEGTRELMEIVDIVSDLTSRPGHGPYPACVTGLPAGPLAALGQRYIENTRIYRLTDKPLFIDKNPNNWAYLGLIHLILPRARIIDARREPMASCFSAFKQNFVSGMEFSYDLAELGRYYNDYVQMMAHFDSVLPGRVHRVAYEDLVADTEGEVRRLLAYCDLPFEPACLRFWETQRAVVTPSSEQVRRPIFREALEHWRHYEPWLGPLREALGRSPPT